MVPDYTLWYVRASEWNETIMSLPCKVGWHISGVDTALVLDITDEKNVGESVYRVHVWSHVDIINDLKAALELPVYKD